MSQTVAEQLVIILKQAGVKRIYAVTGDSLNELNDAIRRDKSIQWIHVRHEEAGAYAASAEAQLNGFACCAGSSGPGHVHLINGLYDADRADAAVLAIASTCNTYEFGTKYFQETNTIKLFDDCSCYNQVAATPAQIPRMTQIAIQHALSYKRVAVLGLPGDVSGMKAVEDNMGSVRNYFPKSIVHPPLEELEQLAELINKHNKISIYCGIGASHAHDEVVQLAATLKAPVGYSFRGKMGIQYDNPYEVGMTGLLGLPSAYHSMFESNLVILLGTDFPYTPFIPGDKDIVQIDIRAERLGRRAPLTMGLRGDVKDTLQKLLPLLNEKNDDHFLNIQLKGYEKVKEHLRIYVKDKGTENKIHPEFVASIINDLADEDAIFTVDTGMCCVWGARYIHANGKRKMIGSFNHGSMANAMPHAIGAALARPGTQVIALAGDGGLSMLLGDLVTIKKYNLPIKLIVFNNRALGMVKLEMEVAGLPDNETDMLNMDFAMIAEAMGIRGITITDPGAVEAGLSEAFKQDGPVLVNILTDPNALAMPPEIEWKQMKGFGVAMTKLMLGGKMEEVLNTVKSNYKHLNEAFD
jgi:pyruvate dehydrogenase (quinone)